MKRMRRDFYKMIKMKTTECVCENINTRWENMRHIISVAHTDVPFPWHLKKYHICIQLLLGKRQSNNTKSTWPEYFPGLFTRKKNVRARLGLSALPICILYVPPQSACSKHRERELIIFMRDWTLQFPSIKRWYASVEGRRGAARSSTYRMAM
jgi:hypothetical protein